MATNKIGIGIDAQIDTAKVEAGLKRIQSQFEKAGKSKIEPVSDKAISNADKLFQQLKRVDTELRRRAKATGQGDASFENFNFESAYPNAGNRAAKLRTVYNYVGAGAPPGAGGGHSGGGFGGMAMGAAQAGLRAAGPVGGVAAGALGTGMASGAGAGLMGLMGGMLALGVGKLVSGVMDKVEQAENNAVAYDKLKRVLGDVSVSFAGLKSVVQGSAKNLSITFDEAGKLSTQFAKSANMKSDQYKTLPDELRTGVGLSRAFGLDPSQGMGVMGQMRGIGVTKDVQDSRRFALLIGETIGKSGAFAKADEVMEAMASYATSQTRSSLGGANVSGYAGSLSAMVGSGIPGLDPAGAASLLGRVNSALSGGGAKGEASQFFTNKVGAGMGLDPIQTQIMREGGAFATNSNSFGKGSVYSRFMGGAGPGGDKTFLDGTLSQLRQQYGSNKGMLAQATSNHLGIGMRQAMGLLSIKPNQMGEMEGYAGDLTKMSGSGIGNLSKALYGSAGDRQNLSREYLGRTGSDKLKAADADAIRNAQGDDSKLRDVLGKIAGKYDQERTQGSDIRDSKNALDNIKTELADKLIPLTQEIRHGIMYMAGAKNGTSPREIMEAVLKAEGKDKLRGVAAEFGGKQAATQATLDAVKAQKEKLTLEYRKQYGAFTAHPEEYQRQMKELAVKEAEATEANNKAKAAYTEAMKKATQELDDSITDNQKGLAPGTTSAARTASAGGGGRGGGGGSASKEDTAEAMKFFMDKGWSKDHAAGIVANLSAESGLKHGVVGDGGKAYGVAQWHPDRQAAFKKWAGKDIRQSTRQEQYGFTDYELTQGNEQDAGNRLKKATNAEQSGAIVSQYYERPKHTSMEARKRASMAQHIAGTPIPGGYGAGAGRGSAESYGIKVDDIIVRHENERGEQVMPSQTIKTKITAPNPRIGGGN